MSRKIFAMPPVPYLAGFVADVFPVAASIDSRTGDEDLSGFGVRRRRVGVTISPLTKPRDGAGAMASLARLLGGVHFVRLRVPPVNWHVDRSAARGPGGGFTAPLTWTVDGDPLSWTTDGEPLTWYTGPVRSGTVITQSGFPAIRVPGFTPGALICRAFDVIRSYASDGSTASARAVRTVYAQPNGVARIPLHDPLPAGIISIGDDEEIICRPVDIGDSDQPTGAEWNFRWTFFEARPTEYAGAEEVNPWI